uniref:Uncharacterized protein n=1 Tax=Rhizophora mucronata TaxID=61149 RepID=A0A2P2MYC6_RHIMU
MGIHESEFPSWETCHCHLPGREARKLKAESTKLSRESG